MGHNYLQGNPAADLAGKTHVKKAGLVRTLGSREKQSAGSARPPCPTQPFTSGKVRRSALPTSKTRECRWGLNRTALTLPHCRMVMAAKPWTDLRWSPPPTMERGLAKPARFPGRKSRRESPPDSARRGARHGERVRECTLLNPRRLAPRACRVLAATNLKWQWFFTGCRTFRNSTLPQSDVEMGRRKHLLCLNE